MRSVRMLLATATATAALAIAPTAYAVTAGDWDQEDGSSHSKEHDKDSSKEHDKDYSKEHGKESKHDGPRGGVHTGGGALAAVSKDDDWGSSKDPKHDPEGHKSKDDGHKKDSWSDEHGKEGKHDGPRGGVRTGGGALAAVSKDDDWGSSKDPKHDPEGHKSKDDGHKKDSWSDEHGKEGKHDGPRGGVRTGGGALAAVTNEDDWGGAKDPKHDPDSYRSKDGGFEKDSWGDEHGKEPWKDDHGKDSWKDDHGKDDSWGDDHEKDSWGGGDHDKPHGGMHTGGGGLDTPGVTAGGLAALAVAGTGMYALRRKKASGTVA